MKGTGLITSTNILIGCTCLLVATYWLFISTGYYSQLNSQWLHWLLWLTDQLRTYWEVIGFSAGVGILLLKQSRHSEGTNEPPYLRLVQAVIEGDLVSNLDMNIAAGTLTLPHVHRQFSKTVTVAAGQLQVGTGWQRQTLLVGDRLTIRPGTIHFIRNVSRQDCHVRITVDPGNEAYEEAMLIAYGLAAEGLSKRASMPDRIGDRALFLTLSDTNVAGLFVLMKPLINWLARRAVKQGRLAELRDRYVPDRLMNHG